VSDQSGINRLVMVTVAGEQLNELTQHLVQDRFYFTQVNSGGGLLLDTPVTLLIGVNESRVPRLLEHLRECCHKRRKYIPAHVEAAPLQIQPVMIEAEVGGAIVSVLNVERFDQV
jgi:uncharacterized protein YaaQ